MKIFRLSFFNLRKNRREAVAIVFLTFITSFLLGTFFTSIAKIDKAFDSSFESTGSVNTAVIFLDGSYRDVYRDILADEYGIEDIEKLNVLNSIGASVRGRDGEKTSYNMYFVTEESERKMEDFKICESLSDEQIGALEHPIWLPLYFSITGGYKVGDTFTMVSGGRDYPFTVAAFYETGFGNESGSGFKMVVSEHDYMLLSGIYESGVMLAFNADRSDYGSSDASLGLVITDENALYEFPISEYIERCEEKSSENINQSVSTFSIRVQKLMETSYVDAYMYLSAFFAIITMAASLFLIRQKISNDIEAQMQQIGVLEALGYRSKEISMSYVYEYVITGGIGAVLGAVAAVAFIPVMTGIIRTFINRNVYGGSYSLRVIPVAAFIVAVILIFALLKAGIIKNYPPVIALRKGIRSHHFGKNVLPLEDTKTNINLRLAAKGYLKNIRHSIGAGICIFLAAVAFQFGIATSSIITGGPDALLKSMGMEMADERITLLEGTDAAGFTEEILAFPEVRKVNQSIDFLYLTVEGQTSGVAIVYDDYATTENIFISEGRFPEHDNEIVISNLRSETYGCGIGDSIFIEGSGTKKSYIITGILTHMSNNRMNLYMTSDGYRRIFPNRRLDVLEVYLEEGADKDAFERKITSIYGASVNDRSDGSAVEGTLEERIRSVADEQMSILISRYGVNDIDYAVKVGDRMITGRSNMVIREMNSLKDLAITQMEPIIGALSGFTIGGTLFICVVVAVLLSMIAASDVRRQRKELGIMKSMGYSSKDLMTQIALKFLPTSIISVGLASIASVFVAGKFFELGFGVPMMAHGMIHIAAGIVLIAFCYAVTYFAAGRVKKVSVTELMTE